MKQFLIWKVSNLNETIPVAMHKYKQCQLIINAPHSGGLLQCMGFQYFFRNKCILQCKKLIIKILSTLFDLHRCVGRGFHSKL